MDEFYTVNQAATTLKVHPLTVRRYIKEGHLKAYRAGGNIRITVNDLKDFVRSIDLQKNSDKNTSSHSNSSSSVTKPFSFTDSLFRIKARGRSMAKLEEVR